MARPAWRLGTLVAIAMGGALGTLARVELGRVVPSGPGFVWGTMIANVGGALLLGAASVAILERLGPSRLVWPLLSTGFCGALTTLSTFAVEVDLRIRSGSAGLGVVYGLASPVLGLAAVGGGVAVSRRWLTPRLETGARRSEHRSSERSDSWN